jgi:hypothetical protein
VPGDVTAQVITNAISIPPRTGQQVLHPIRCGIPRMLGDRPAVLARQVRQQPKDERPRMPPRLHPDEPARDPPHQLIEHPLPKDRVTLWPAATARFS